MVIVAIVLAFLGFSALMSIVFGKAVHRLGRENDYDWTSFPLHSAVAGQKSSRRPHIAAR